MTKKEMLQLAAKVNEKNWNFEQLKYSDDLNGHEEDADLVWEYVLQCDKIGTEGMKAKYPDWPQ
jgi:hypothetical protein